MAYSNHEFIKPNKTRIQDIECVSLKQFRPYIIYPKWRFSPWLSPFWDEDQINYRSLKLTIIEVEFQMWGSMTSFTVPFSLCLIVIDYMVILAPSNLSSLLESLDFLQFFSFTNFRLHVLKSSSRQFFSADKVYSVKLTSD